MLTTFRRIRRQPLTALIQAVGLSVGFACFIVGFGAVHYWSMSDRQYVDSDRVYVVKQDVIYKGTPPSGASLTAAYHVAKYVRSDIPELQAVARAVNWSALPARVGDRMQSLRVAGADPEFFRIFRQEEGGPSVDALRAPRSVVLTSEAADRLYGSTEVVGRALRLNDQLDLRVTGIFDPPQPSHIGRDGHIRFDLLVSWDVIETLIRATEPAIADESNEIWFARCCVTYVQLPGGWSLTPAALERRLDDLVGARVPASQRAFADIELGAVPLNALQSTELERLLFANSGVDIPLSFALLVLASIVLAVACLNYANLAGAQVLDEAGQLGVRRILGADRGALAGQRLLDSAMYATVALLAALFAMAMFSAPLSQYLAFDPAAVRGSGRFWISILAVWAFAACAAGAWPALLVFLIRPGDSLRSARGRTARNWRSTSVVAAQFAIASILVSVVIVVRMQHDELERIGLDSVGRVAVVTNNLATAGVAFGALKAELIEHPQIESVSAASVLPWEFRTLRNPLSRSPSGRSAVVNASGDSVWYDFFRTMDIELLAGRTFSPAFDDVSSSMFADPSKPNHVVIDEKLVAQLGFTSPQAAVDQLIYVSNPFAAAAQSLRIIGVVESKPAHFVGGGATSGSYQLHPSARFPLIRIRGEDTAGALAAIDEVWRELAPQSPIRRQFVDELFNRNFRIFASVSRAFHVLTALALGIACLGLLGMAMHVVRNRTHEIGVRKSLGASAPHVLAMLVRDFSKPALIANLLALPLAALAAQVYLSVFIHQIPLSASPFLASLLVTLLAAWAAIGLQAVRASRLEPARVLRHE